MLSAGAPELIKSDVAGGANGAARCDVNKITIFGSWVWPQIDRIKTLGSEFGVIGLFKKGLNWAAENAEATNVRANSG